MFEAIAMFVIATTLFGVVVDDEFYRLLNTVANLATVTLLVWHQRHVRGTLEPKMDTAAAQVDSAAALVRRKLGDRDPTHADDYDGPERRKVVK